MSISEQQRYEYSQIELPFKPNNPDRIDFINNKAGKGWRFVSSFIREHTVSWTNGTSGPFSKPVTTECMTFEREVS